MQKAARVYQPSLTDEEAGKGKNDFSFQPSSRLLQPAQYTNLFKGGRRINGRGLTLLVKSNETSFPRLGLTIPKRLVKRAVDRNAIKRRVRESFRLNRFKLGPVDIVIMANPGISKLSNRQVSELINSLWNRIVESK